ncbi:MAG: tRNA 2-selenouridine(34) synthase MnmH [Salinivirgaceae bacterium]|nr:tRNA 2-selenouridine(34) synthase MnmH [Salinivirgaceae bacterium]
MPWATNIALFSNTERAEVGTIYKQKTKEKAIELGYTFVNPKLDLFIQKSIEVAPDKVLAVHCWRGGMRSAAFAEHLSNNGFNKVYLIEGGYKAFRNAILTFFEREFKLNVLGGYTGSGKTDILIQLKELGQQVVDLEELAHHQGSAFGGIGKKEQPSTEHFENILFDQMRKFSDENPIWIEDESSNIGKVFIPKALFDQMRNQKVYFIDIPVSERAKYLVGTYGTFEKTKLEESILRIQKRLGFDKTKKALQALSDDDLKQVAEILLFYYDKGYLKGLDKRNENDVTRIPLSKIDALDNAKALLACIH